MPNEGHRFINPYTFVSLPRTEPAGHRAEPPGHDHLRPDHYSGTLNVTLTARSPLLLRNVYDEDCAGNGEDKADGQFPVRHFPGFDGAVPYIPGSSLAGAVRSLHETIAGGCLRVFDEEFLPVYRDPVGPQRGTWCLACVQQVDERGAPRRMTLCRQTAWVEHKALHLALGGQEKLHSGARVSLDLSRAEEGPQQRKELTDPSAVRALTEKGSPVWVVLVTDSGARTNRHFCAAGKTESSDTEVVVSSEVWDSYRRSVESTRDMQLQRQNPYDEDALTAPVKHNTTGALVGYRNVARPSLREGQIVWVSLGAELKGGARQLKGIALSSIWRHQGKHKAGDRVASHMNACADPEDLCPSCRLFGSVDAKGEDRSPGARQRAYGGHVRFGDAVAHAPYQRQKRFLPPLGSPKPGSGQFYLHTPEHFGGAAEKKTQRGKLSAPPDFPLREWGAKPDDNEVRPLRGRKYPWLTQHWKLRPYFRTTAQHQDAFHTADHEPVKNNLLSTAESVAEGSCFSFDIHFENLNAGSLGGLLAALDPTLILRRYGSPESDEQPLFGWAVGGGRPLGFGTCTADVSVAALETTESRYLEQDPPSYGVEELVQAFRESVSADIIQEVWQRELSKVLRLDWARSDLVWYPPAANLSGVDKPLLQALGPSFTFWSETSGSSDRDKKTNAPTKPLTQLPSASAMSPTMSAIDQRDEGGAR